MLFDGINFRRENGREIHLSTLDHLSTGLDHVRDVRHYFTQGLVELLHHASHAPSSTLLCAQSLSSQFSIIVIIIFISQLPERHKPT